MEEWKKVIWKERPEIRIREPAMSKEVTPCSEYTRFTAEGRFKDPHSDSSAIMAGDLVGFLFKSSPFVGPKWSDRLGYGIAVIGDDTRIHLHANGKYVIRRAIDRDHAQEAYMALANLAKPAVYSTMERRFVWEIVRDNALSSAFSESSSIEELMSWPDDLSGDEVLERATEVFKEADELYSSRFRELVQSGSITGPVDLMEKLPGPGESFSAALDSIFNRNIRKDPGGILGWGSYILLLRAAVEG